MPPPLPLLQPALPPHIQVAPPRGLQLKLAIVGEREPLILSHPPEANFGELLRACCAKAGLDPSRYRLQFDGETLAPGGKPEDKELEEGDMIEVVHAR